MCLPIDMHIEKAAFFIPHRLRIKSIVYLTTDGDT